MQLPNNKLLLIGAGIILLVIIITLILPIINTQTITQNFSFSEFEMNKTITIQGENRTETYTFNTQNPVVGYLIIPKTITTSISDLKISGDYLVEIIEEDPILFIEQKEYTPGTKTITIQTKTGEIKHSTILLPINLTDYQAFSEAEIYELNQTVKQFNEIDENFYSIEETKKIIEEFAQGTASSELKKKVNENDGIFFSEAEISLHNASLKQILKLRQIENTTTNTPNNSKFRLTGSTLNSTISSLITPRLKKETTTQNEFEYSLEITFSKQITSQIPEQIIIPFSKNQKETYWRGEILLTQAQIPLEEDIEFEIITPKNIITSFEKKEIANDYIKFELEVKINPSDFQNETIIYDEIIIQPKKLLTSPITIPLTLIKNNCNYSNNSLLYPLIKEDSEEYLRKISNQAILCLIIETDQEINQIIDSNTPNFPLNLELFEIEDNLLLNSIMLNDLDSYKEILKRKKELITEEQSITLKEKEKLEKITNQIFNLIDTKQNQARDYYDFLNNEILTFTYLTESYFNRIQLLLDPDKNIFREDYIKNRSNYFALQSEDSKSSIEKKVNDELNYYFGSGNSEKIEILKIEQKRLELEIKTLDDAILDIREGKFDDPSIVKSISEWWGVLIRDRTKQDLIDSFWESEEIIREEISELTFQLEGIKKVISQMEYENKTLIEIYENNYTKSKDILSGKLIEDGAFRNKVVSGLVKQINLLRFNENVNNQIDALALYQDIQTINYFKTNEVMHQIIYEQKIDEKENPNNPIYLWKKYIWTKDSLNNYCEIEREKICEIEKQRIGMNKIIDQILKGKNLIEIQKENEYVFSEQEEIKPSEDDWYIKAALENLPIQLEIEKEEIMLTNFSEKKEQYEKAKTDEEKLKVLIPKETEGELALNLAEYYLTIGLTDVAREQYEQIQLEYTAFPKIISKARSLERKDVWWTVKNATTQYTKGFFTTDRIITYAIFSFTFRAIGRAQATRQYKSESIRTWETTKLRAKVPWEKQHFSKLPSSTANTQTPILNGDITVEVLSSPNKIPKVANKVTGKDGFFETQQVGNYQIQNVDGLTKINFKPAQTQAQGTYKISYEGGQPRFDFYKTGNYDWVKSQPSGGVSGGSFRATTQPSIGGKSGFVRTTTQTINTTKLNSPFAKIKATQSSGITSPQTGISTPQTTFETVGNLALQPSTLDLTYLNSSIVSSSISPSIQPNLIQPTGLFATPLISSIGLFLEERRQLNNLYQNYQATIIQTSQLENDKIPSGIKNTLLLHQQLISQQNKIDQIICPNCKAIIEVEVPDESEKIPLEFSTAIFDPELPLTIGEIKFENKSIENLNVKIIISSKNTTPTWTITLEGKTPTLLILSPIEPEILLQNNVEIKKEIFSINEDGLVQTGGLVSQTKAASTTLFIEDEEGNITTVQVDLDIATARNTYQGLGTIVGAFDNSELSGSETKSNLPNEKTPDFALLDSKISQIISSKPEFKIDIPIEGTTFTINRRSFTGALGSADIYYLTDKQSNSIYIVKKELPEEKSSGRDRTEYKSLIPGRTEFERFSEIPKELINTGHLNPILYNSPNGQFYIAKFIDGYEDEEIFLHLSPEEAGLKLSELAYLVAKNNVMTPDVSFQTGHNIIYNKETEKLMLFDHGAQYYDPSFSSIEIGETLIQYVISRNANLQIQLEKNLETGKIEMSEKAKNKIIMGYYFITNLAQKLGLTKMPLNRVSTENPNTEGYIFTNENYVPIPKTFEEYLELINQILPENLYVPAFKETIQKSELEEIINNSLQNYTVPLLINSTNTKIPTLTLTQNQPILDSQCTEGCVGKANSIGPIVEPTEKGVLAKFNQSSIQQNLILTPITAPNPQNLDAEKWQSIQTILNNWTNDAQSETTKLVRKKLVESVIYVEYNEWLSNLKKSVDLFNQKNVGDYAVLFDRELGKSKRWVFEKARPYLTKQPSAMLYGPNDDVTRSESKNYLLNLYNSGIKTIIVFDDGIYSGNQITELMNYIFNIADDVGIKRQDLKIFVVVPYSTKGGIEVIGSVAQNIEVFSVINMPTSEEIIGDELMNHPDVIREELFIVGKPFTSLFMFQHKVPDVASFYFGSQLADYITPIYRTDLVYHANEKLSYTQYIEIVKNLGRIKTKEIAVDLTRVESIKFTKNTTSENIGQTGTQSLLISNLFNCNNSGNFCLIGTNPYAIVTRENVQFTLTQINSNQKINLPREIILPGNVDLIETSISANDLPQDKIVEVRNAAKNLKNNEALIVMYTSANGEVQPVIYVKPESELNQATTPTSEELLAKLNEITPNSIGLHGTPSSNAQAILSEGIKPNERGIYFHGIDVEALNLSKENPAEFEKWYTQKADDVSVLTKSAVLDNLNWADLKVDDFSNPPAIILFKTDRGGIVNNVDGTADQGLKQSQNEAISKEDILGMITVTPQEYEAAGSMKNLAELYYQKTIEFIMNYKEPEIIQKEFSANDFSALSRAKTNSLQLQLEISRIFREAISIYLTPQEKVGAGVVVSGSVAREEAGMSDVDIGIVGPNLTESKKNQIYSHIITALERLEFEVDSITETAIKKGTSGDVLLQTNLLDLTLISGGSTALEEVEQIQQRVINNPNFGNEIKTTLNEFTQINNYSDWTVKGNKRELDYLLFYLKWKYQTAGKPTVQTINELIQNGAITSEEGNAILTQLDEMINIRQKLDLIKLKSSAQETNEFKLRNGKDAFDEGYVEGFSVKLADELGFDTVEEFETYYKNVVKENRTIINNILGRF